MTRNVRENLSSWSMRACGVGKQMAEQMVCGRWSEEERQWG